MTRWPSRLPSTQAAGRSRRHSSTPASASPAANKHLPSSSGTPAHAAARSPPHPAAALNHPAAHAAVYLLYRPRGGTSGGECNKGYARNRSSSNQQQRCSLIPRLLQGEHSSCLANREGRPACEAPPQKLVQGNAHGSIEGPCAALPAGHRHRSVAGSNNTQEPVTAFLYLPSACGARCPA